jgi:hypothetical protein
MIISNELQRIWKEAVRGVLYCRDSVVNARNPSITIVDLCDEIQNRELWIKKQECSTFDRGGSLLFYGFS